MVLHVILNIIVLYSTGGLHIGFNLLLIFQRGGEEKKYT